VPVNKPVFVLCALCAFFVSFVVQFTTKEAQRTQRCALNSMKAPHPRALIGEGDKGAESGDIGATKGASFRRLTEHPQVTRSTATLAALSRSLK